MLIRNINVLYIDSVLDVIKYTNKTSLSDIPIYIKVLIKSCQIFFKPTFLPLPTVVTGVWDPHFFSSQH